MNERAETFSNGLSDSEEDAIFGAISEIISIKAKIEAMGRHRTYSLAATKLDEARLWFRDRLGQPA